MSDLDAARERRREAWEAMAPGWNERREDLWSFSRPVSEWLVDRLDPKPGETILDLAAGLGETGFLAAQLVGDSGSVLVTDFAPSMLAAARQRAEEFGIANADFLEMDAEQMGLASESVDGVCCRWGYMLMTDPAAAFSETHRVLRSNGRLSFSVFNAPEHNTWASAVSQILVESGHMPRPERASPGIFAMSDRGRIQELVTRAGFASPDIEAMHLTWRFPDYDAYWYFLTKMAGAISPILKGLSSEDQEVVRSRIREAIRPYGSDDGYAFPVLCLNVATAA